MSITDVFPAEAAKTVTTPTQSAVNDGDVFTGGGQDRKYRLAPTVSWARARVGASFRYILLPAPEGSKGPAHDRVEQTEMGGEVKRHDNGDAKFQYELTMATDLENYDLLSENAVERKKEHGEEDDSARVLVIKWPNERQAKKGVKHPGPFIDNVLASGAKIPEVGAYGTVTLVERRKNNGGQPSPIIVVTYNRPTEATIAKAQQVAAERAVAREARRAAQENQPLAQQSQEDAPPF